MHTGDLDHAHGRVKGDNEKMKNHLGWILVVALVALGRPALAAHAAGGDTGGDSAVLANDLSLIDGYNGAVSGDRDQMANDISNPSALKADVVQFFFDRSIVVTVDGMIGADFKTVLKDLKLKSAKGASKKKSSGKGSANVSQDAATFISDFDNLTTLNNTVDNDLQALNKQISTNGNISAAVTTYITDRHSQFIARLQLVADLSQLEKDKKFKGTGSVTKRAGGALTTDVQQFLTDRTAWVADRVLVNTDINNLRAVLGTASLDATVTQLLTDRHTLFLAELQLEQDRFAMRKDAGVKSKGKEPKAGALSKNAEFSELVNDPDMEILLICAGAK
jgi:hypothetical protein